MINLFIFIKRKFFISLPIIILVIFLIPKNVLAYNSQSGHPALTYEIAQFYNDNFDKKLTEEEIAWLMKGSAAEDTPPRWINHFYNPLSGGGWDAKKLGNVDQKTLSWLSKWAISNRDPLSAENWVSNGSAQEDYGRYGGNQSWYKAIQSYVDGDMEDSFYALGHILHLVEDMTVPEHTRSDTHAGLIGDKGSPYENYVKKITENNIKGLDLAEKAKQLGLKPINKPAIQLYITDNAKYSHNNFFSEDTIDFNNYPNKNNLQYIIESKTNTLIMITDNSNTTFPIAALINGEKTLKDPKIMSAYFERLGRQAVISGAGAINLFFKDAETRRITQEKNPSAKKENKTQSNGVFSPFGELVKLSKIFNPITQFASNFFGSTAKTSTRDDAVLNNQDSSNSVVMKDEIEPAENIEEDTVKIIDKNIKAKEESSVDVISDDDHPVILDSIQNPGILNNDTDAVEAQPLYISRVIDGDTVTLNNGKDVRLIGIDTPEYGEKCFEEAKKELERLILGKEVILKKDVSETDKYDRLLRYIYLDNVFINAEMLSSGFSHVMTIPPDTKYYQNFKALEEEAKFFERGCLFSLKKDETELQADQNNVTPNNTTPVNTAPVNNIITSYATAYGNSINNEEAIPELIDNSSPDEEMATSTPPADDNFSNEETATSTPVAESDDIAISTTSTIGSVSVVINEIQVGGENPKDEFIELYNITTSTINLSNWKLTKKTKSGNESNLISSFPDGSLIPANSYFLIITEDTTNFTATSTADTTYTGGSYSIAKDNTIILKDDNDNVIDKVGYGDASDFEDMATINPLDNMSISRVNFIDTDNNFNDFIISSSTPQASSSTPENNIEETEEEVEEENEEDTIVIADNTCTIPTYGTHEKNSGSVNRSLANDVLTERTLAQFNSGQTVTLTADNNPYYIDDPLTVRSTSKLIIEAGVIIKFGRWRTQSGITFPIDLLIQGDLEINGTVDNPVIFTTFRDDEHGTPIEISNTDPAPLDWGGLKIESSAGHNISINYLEAYYGGGSINGSNTKDGAILFNFSNANIAINNSKVYYSGSGLYSSALNQPNIMNNIFSHNNLWGAYIKESAPARIIGNTFICNGSPRTAGSTGTTGGLGMEGDISQIEFSQNNFINNQNFGLNYYTTTSSTLNATNSYWGDASGPYHTSNTSTSGNTVSDNINFSPWSTTQY